MQYIIIEGTDKEIKAMRKAKKNLGNRATWKDIVVSGLIRESRK